MAKPAIIKNKSSCLVHQLGCKEAQCLMMVERPAWWVFAETAWDECNYLFGGHLAHIGTYSTFSWIRQFIQANIAVQSSCNVRFKNLTDGTCLECVFLRVRNVGNLHFMEGKQLAYTLTKGHTETSIPC